LSHQIEISIDVDVTAGVAFWIDQEEWDALDDDEKRVRIGAVIDDVAAELSNDIIRFRTGNLSASIIGPEDDKIVLSTVQVYDPEAT
jgi:hypothetical protein